MLSRTSWVSVSIESIIGSRLALSMTAILKHKNYIDSRMECGGGIGSNKLTNCTICMWF